MPDQQRESEAAQASSSGRWVPIQDVVREARGPRYLGVDRNVLVFVGLHAAGVAALLLLRTHLLTAFSGALRLSSLYDACYAGGVVLLLGVHCWNYRRLYASDPGWITFDSKLDDPQPPCRFCRQAPSLRSRHDFHTGQCVRKFDHWCWLLGTSIGDLNHARFWAFCLLQVALVLWALVLAGHRLLACSLQAGCSLGSAQTAGLLALLLLLLGALNVFGGLLLLHSYLAATNMTTYELLKGEKVPYLRPYFASYSGPRQAGLLGRPLLDLLRRAATGRGPPAPFSCREGPLGGVAANLELFFFAKKPHTYRLQQAPPAESQP